MLPSSLVGFLTLGFARFAGMVNEQQKLFSAC